MRRRFPVLILLCTAVFAVLLTGCATTKSPYNIIEKQKKEIGQLKDRLKESEKKIELAQNDLRERIKTKEEEFNATQDKLMKQFKNQLKAGEIKIENLKRGLVLTVLNSVLFDSGKAEIKDEGKETLQKVANVLKEDCPDKDVSIEGHTDNEPIKYSGWKSNWELSTARANSILHFFIDKGGIKSERLRVVGFGEHRPAASNETEEGRQQNRRVEIVILPEEISKVEAGR